MMRIEKDFIGELKIDDQAFYGIHSIRAKNNFPDTTTFPIEWFKAIGTVKKACYLTCKEFYKELKTKYSNPLPITIIEADILETLIESASEIESGKYFEHFIVPAISGGAGTSINMNVNEIIANVSLRRLNHKLGEYTIVDPIEHANVYQSTNDVIPTALKVAVMYLLRQLETSINELRTIIEQHERNHATTLRIGYTQMQEAVPSSFGRLFSTYNEALSRDWWRISKCSERIKIINLGGSAIGTGITVPRFFIMEVAQTLQMLTRLPVTHAENMNDATCNLDSFVEIHGILKAHAVNMEKMSNDIRLLASDVVSNTGLKIPQMQVGSSIMPAKVNPVIPEFIISSAHKVYSNDVLISSLSAQGCLELNAYIPVIGHCLIESIKLLIASCQTAKENLFTGLLVDATLAYNKMIVSPSITTALLPHIGYKKATALALEMKEKHSTIFEANDILKLIDANKLKTILEPQNILKEGFSVNDINKI